MSKTMSAAEFKAKCLEVLDRVAATGEIVTVTKRGKPVARVAPLVEKPARVVGAMKHDITITGDVTTPLDVRWNALKP
jgi:prevent-host-death family protein